MMYNFLKIGFHLLRVKLRLRLRLAALARLTRTAPLGFVEGCGNIAYVRFVICGIITQFSSNVTALNLFVFFILSSYGCV